MDKFLGDIKKSQLFYRTHWAHTLFLPQGNLFIKMLLIAIITTFQLLAMDPRLMLKEKGQKYIRVGAKLED